LRRYHPLLVGALYPPFAFSRYPVHTAALAVFGFLVQDGAVVSHTISKGPFVVLLQGMRRSVGRSGAANAEGLQGLVPSEQALKQPWGLAYDRGCSNGPTEFPPPDVLKKKAGGQ
jgi:hypothetical protein